MQDDIKLPPRPEPDGFITDGPFDKPVVINVYRDSTLEAYAREAVRMNACEFRASTHAADCWSWGPAHYECAVREIKALRAERDALRKALARLITWTPSADTYRRLGFDPDAPMRVLEEARAVLAHGGEG